jgi:hypothetical protein
MANFVEAYKSGLQAANTAKNNKLEIDSVFIELDQQLQKATNGAISVVREEIKDPPKQKISVSSSGRKLGTRLTDLSERDLDVLLNTNTRSDDKQTFHWAIVAENKRIKDAIKELAKWTPHPAGYPCEITVGSKIIYCEDKRGLERALMEMLRDPGVGETLSKLIKLSPQEPASNNGPTGSPDLTLSDESKVDN